MKHSGKSTVCLADNKNDRLCYKIEKLSIEELSDSTSKTMSCKKDLPSNIGIEMCEKSEQCNKPDRSVQETIITLNEKGISQAISETDQKLLSETDNHYKNIVVIKEQVIDAIQANSDTAGECKIDHRSDAEEQITLKTECSNPDGSLKESTKTNSSSSVVNKRKQRQIMKKKLEKDEKRRQRELEFLKNLLPKEQRVQIVDQNTFQKILKDSDSSQSESKSLGLSFDEFPALNLLKNEDKFTTNLKQHISVVQGTGSKTARELGTQINNIKQHKRVSESNSAGINEMENKNEMPRESDRQLNHVKQQKSVSKSHSALTHEIIHKYKMPRELDRTVNHVRQHKSVSVSHFVDTHEIVHKNEMKLDVSTKTGLSGGVRKPGKPPKKRDPIKIDILHCIKVVKPKNTPVDPKKRSSSLEKASRGKENSLIGGNELDSSNPQRFKGKKREQPRSRRPTKLRVVILHERELKKKLKELETQTTSQENQEQKEVPVCTSAIVATDPQLNQIKYEDSTQDLQSNLGISAVQESADLGNLLSFDAVKKEGPEVDFEKHCLSVASGDGTQNALHQEKQEKPSTYKVSDILPRHTEEILGLHYRKFRPYCDHMITDEINNSVRSLLQDIVKFHDRQYERDPVKANARRRHVTGFREVLKHLSLKRLKLIIIAPDLDLIEGKGGILDIVEQLKEGAKSQEIPHVFALHRKALGKITFKKVPVSCIGVISYDGTEKNFHALMEALPEARKQYQEAVANAVQKHGCNGEVDVNKQVIASILSKLAEKSTLVPREQIEEEEY